MSKSKLEEIKKILEILFEINGKDLFIAQIINEKLDYKQDILDVSDGDIEYAERIYEKVYLENDNCNTKWNSDIWDAINGDYEFESEE